MNITETGDLLFLRYEAKNIHDYIQRMWGKTCDIDIMDYSIAYGDWLSLTIYYVKHQGGNIIRISTELLDDMIWGVMINIGDNDLICGIYYLEYMGECELNTIWFELSLLNYR